MTPILLLLAVSALAGVLVGLFFLVYAVVISSLILALLAAAVLQNEGFGMISGIAMIVICLIVHQLAYMFAAALTNGSRKDQ